jgi:hypothetical protein
MGGLHKSIKKVMPKELVDPINKKVMDENIRTHKSLSRRMDPQLPPEEAPIPMADEEEIKRNKRKGQSARGGGRASTILTGGDQEALGG